MKGRKTGMGLTTTILRWRIPIRCVTAIQEIVAGFIGTFKDFPPRQKPAKFNVDDVMATMYKTGAH